MKVLIIGTGIIGTIYGWALSVAGDDVTHFIRKGKSEKYNNGVLIDILDERKGYKKHNQTGYSIKVTEKIDTSFNLVIVPTNWIQTEEAIRTVIPYCSDSFFYILTSNWNGTGMFDNNLGKDKYILGYPDGGGTIRENVYWTNIGPEIHIASPTSENQKGFGLIQDLFSRADIRLDVQENMLHWLWVHNAGSIPVVVALQKHKNLKKFLADKDLLKKSFIATRECLKLCEKRGAYSNRYPEISAFKLPMWLLIPMFKFNFRHNESMQRYTAHGESIPLDDIICNFNDILNTANNLGFEMPHYKELAYLIEG